MAFLYNQIPSWAINWVNKEFLLSEEPIAILDVVLDWVEYYSFSVVGKILTLLDAPTNNLWVDFEYGTSPAPISTNWYGNTLKEIYDRVYTMLAEETDVDLFNLEKTVKPTINQVHNNICKGVVADETTQPHTIIRARELRFLNKTTPIVNPGDARTDTDTLVWASYISADTRKLLSSGYVVINGNVIRYRWKNDSMITGIDLGTLGVENAYSVGATIHQVYPIPQDALQTLQLVRDSDWHILKETNYRTNDRGDYKIITDNALTNNRYILFNHPRNGSYTLTYKQAPVKLIEDADKCNLPDDYGLSVLAPIVAGKLLYSSDEQWLAISFLRAGYAELHAMYIYFGQPSLPYRSRVKVRPFDFN